MNLDTMDNDTPATPQPIDASKLPRYAGPATFMRLPLQPEPQGLDIALVGVPWDAGTTNRPGARHGPRAVRDQSSLVRYSHHVSGISPFKISRIADIGDMAVNPFNIPSALKTIESNITRLNEANVAPVVVGGDHLVTLPVLRALGRKKPLGLIHFDAHSDTNDQYFGDNPYTHGTVFRRAIEEGLLDPKRVVQIGIRGTQYACDEHQWARDQGIRIIYIEEAVELGPAGTAKEIRRIIGDHPTYLTFDIDSLDPSMAPGTGTPEIGGFTSREAQIMLRGLAGIPLVGADLVEVSPPFDVGGITALTAATLLFEILCIMAPLHAFNGATSSQDPL